MKSRILKAILKGINEGLAKYDFDLDDYEDNVTSTSSKKMNTSDIRVSTQNVYTALLAKCINKLISDEFQGMSPIYQDYIDIMNQVKQCLDNGATYSASNDDLLNVICQYCKYVGWETDLNWIDTSNVTDMSKLFDGIIGFNCDISKWVVSNVTNMFRMFYQCYNFNGDLGNWDVSNVKSMNGMFYNCHTYTGKNISSWDVSNVENMNNMFFYAKSFNENIGNWDTSKVTNMSFMFYKAISFNQDISNWDLSNLLEAMGTFMGCGIDDNCKPKIFLPT